MIIKNGKIHTGIGEVLENCDICVKDGVIKKIGQNLCTEGEEIIDASGKEVFPGFIDPVNYLGCIDMAYAAKDCDEKSKPVTPYVNIKHSFDPDEMMRQRLFESGITSVGLSPANKNVIGGQMAVMKTYGNNVNKMTVAEQRGLKASVIDLVKDTFGAKNMCPNSRMAIISMLKEAFEGAQKNITKTGFRENYSNAVLQKVLNKEMALFVTADTKAEIDSVLEALGKFDIDIVICNAYQAGNSLCSIKKAGASVVIGELTNMSTELYNETDLAKIASVQQSGGLVSISLIGDDNVYGREAYFWTISKLRKAGVSSADVLKMITVNPSKMLGVSDRIGSIEEGKDADIVIYTHDPLEFCDACVVQTIIDGKIIYAKDVEVCC